MWQNFNTKQGTQKKKTVGMETLYTHFFTNGIYFVQKNLSSIRMLTFIVFTSQSHKGAYFYDVGSTYAIDQKNQSFAQ